MNTLDLDASVKPKASRLKSRQIKRKDTHDCGSVPGDYCIIYHGKSDQSANQNTLFLISGLEWGFTGITFQKQ